MKSTTWITVVILELIHGTILNFGRGVFIRMKTSRPSLFVSNNNFSYRMLR